MVSRTKAYVECKCAFEKIYGTLEGSFNKLLRYMYALKCYIPCTVVEWKLEWHDDDDKDVFKYVF